MNCPVITYLAPTSLPMRAAVCASTRPDVPRFCSSIKRCTCSRSTSRAWGLVESSEMSMAARPRSRASKFSLSCPKEPLFTNGNTAIPGRVSWPRAWPAAPPTKGNASTTAAHTATTRPRMIAPRSESQVHAFLRRQHLGGSAAPLRLPARRRQQLIERLVVVLRLVMEQHQPLHLRFRRQPHRLRPRRMPPAAVHLQLLRRVHRVVDEQVHPLQEFDELAAPQRRGAVVATLAQLVVGRVGHAWPAPFRCWTMCTPRARMPVPASRMTSCPSAPSTATHGVLPP